MGFIGHNTVFAERFVFTTARKSSSNLAAPLEDVSHAKQSVAVLCSWQNAYCLAYAKDILKWSVAHRIAIASAISTLVLIDRGWAVLQPRVVRIPPPTAPR